MRMAEELKMRSADSNKLLAKKHADFKSAAG
jgi:hypothetical protein